LAADEVPDRARRRVVAGFELLAQSHELFALDLKLFTIDFHIN
jgi:hypothetical protein